MENYEKKFKKFLKEEAGMVDSIQHNLDLLKINLPYPQDQIEAYIESVNRDISRGNTELYSSMSYEDFMEDFEMYLQDRI